LCDRGRELVKDQTLESAGVQAGDTVVIVRRVLSADGEEILLLYFDLAFFLVKK
jgi:hypothetical protein